MPEPIPVPLQSDLEHGGTVYKLYKAYLELKSSANAEEELEVNEKLTEGVCPESASSNEARAAPEKLTDGVHLEDSLSVTPSSPTFRGDPRLPFDDNIEPRNDDEHDMQMDSEKGCSSPKLPVDDDIESANGDEYDMQVDSEKGCGNPKLPVDDDIESGNGDDNDMLLDFDGEEEVSPLSPCSPRLPSPIDKESELPKACDDPDMQVDVTTTRQGQGESPVSRPPNPLSEYNRSSRRAPGGTKSVKRPLKRRRIKPSPEPESADEDDLDLSSEHVIDVDLYASMWEPRAVTAPVCMLNPSFPTTYPFFRSSWSRISISKKYLESKATLNFGLLIQVELNTCSPQNFM